MPLFTDQKILQPLTSTDQIAVAHTLADMMIDTIAQSPTQGGARIAEKLRAAATLAWSQDKSAAPTRNKDEHIQREMKALLADLTKTQVQQFAEGYARLGHMYEVAGQIARENFFQKKNDSFTRYLKQSGNGKIRKANASDVIPGSVQEMLFSDATSAFTHADATIQALNAPVFEPVFTMHPTNLNTAESIEALRKVTTLTESAVSALGKKEQVAEAALALRAALEEYVNTPLTPVTSAGMDRNFNVHDETKLVLQFLKNIYEDLPRTYAEFDTALQQKFGAEYDAVKAGLQLNMPLSSWGSAGDKDGNSNVKSENTLEAIALHKQTITSLYANDLLALQTSGEAPELVEKWLPELLKQSNRLTAQINVLEYARAKSADGNDIALTQQEFNVISRNIANATIDSATFIADLETAAKQNPENEKTLTLLRRARTFGSQFARIEYRETAEEYARVVDRLIPPEIVQAKLHLDKPTRYSELATDDGAPDTKRRTELLTSIITESPETVRMMGETFLAGANGEALRSYSTTNADAIAYHSLKRMELARDHPEMIRNNVLAECQDTSNLLEAQFLQLAAGNKEKRPVLGIIPLFEEPATMSRAAKIMSRAYDNAAYQEQLRTVADAQHNGAITQQVQIAHSDNARRSGVAAARGFIHAVHPLLRDETAKHTINGQAIQLQFYEGGSQSDAYRNGVRSITAMVNAFGLHRFTKTTFQGGDLVNYFNSALSLTRMLTRHFVHAAETLANPAHKRLQRYQSAENLATEALIGTLQHYEADHFNERTNPIGHLFADPRVDYLREAAAGNASSRATLRAGAKAANAGTDADPEFAHFGKPIATDKMRTISFSETFQHGAGIVPSWVGTESLYEQLNVSMRAIKQRGVYDAATNPKGYKPEEYTVQIRDKNKGTQTRNLFEADIFDPTRQELTSLGLNVLYQASPAFRDNIDKCAYGLIMSDMAGLSERIASSTNSTDNVRDYVRHLTDNYQATFSLVHRALTGKAASLTHGGETHAQKPATYREILKQLPELAHLKPIDPKLAYLNGLDALRDTPEYAQNAHIRRVVHNGKDTVYHGRTLAADDIRYGLALVEQEQKRAAYR